MAPPSPDSIKVEHKLGRHFVSVMFREINHKETFLLPAVGVVFPRAPFICKLSFRIKSVLRERVIGNLSRRA